MQGYRITKAGKNANENNRVLKECQQQFNIKALTRPDQLEHTLEKPLQIFLIMNLPIMEL